MCTVIVAWQCFADAPLVVAANRDELLARPSDPPLLLQRGIPRQTVNLFSMFLSMCVCLPLSIPL